MNQVSSNEAPTDIMIVSPHPDDSEFGTAGSVARWVKEGKDVVYVICTSGEKGTSDPKVKPNVLAAMRKKEQLAAAKLLGVRKVIFLGYEDQTLEDNHPLRRDIVCCIRAFKPHTVVTANPYRRYIWHRDHRIAGQVVLDAVFPYARDVHSYPDLYEEGLLPHKVQEVLLWASDDADYFSDITATFDIKVAALRCHDSQVGGDKFPTIELWLRKRAVDAASGQDFELAEAFKRVEMPF